MYRALVWKELRESAVVAGLGLAAFVCLIARCTGAIQLPSLGIVGVPEVVPFAIGWYLGWCIALAGGIGIVLGLRQSGREVSRGTFLFLLHRPLRRERLIGVKLLVGLAVYLACTGLPTLAYACWAATPRTHPSPFEWSMTATTWEVLVALTPMYLAGFLCGLRPGRWYGSWLLPLAGVALLVELVEAPPTVPLVGRLALIALLNAALASSILFVGRTRDY